MDILNEIASELQDVDEKNVTTPLITSVLLKLEDYVKALKQKNLATPSFAQVAENLTNKALQEQMMEVRMVLLKQAFMKMYCLVRDVSHKTNKKV